MARDDYWTRRALADEAESGVRAPEDVSALKRIGADAVLVGEALMRAPDRGAMLSALREAAR